MAGGSVRLARSSRERERGSRTGRGYSRRPTVFSERRGVPTAAMLRGTRSIGRLDGQRSCGRRASADAA